MVEVGKYCCVRSGGLLPGAAPARVGGKLAVAEEEPFWTETCAGADAKLYGEVLHRVNYELERARFHFQELPDDVAFADSNTSEWRKAEEKVEAFASEFQNVRDFLNAVGIWRPRNERKRPLPA